MKICLHKDSRGFSHVLLIVGALLVIALIGLIGMRVMKESKNNLTNGGSSEIAKKIAEANCEYDDKDLCKFLTGWREIKEFKVQSTSSQDGKTYGYTLQVDGDRTHMYVTGEVPYEVMTIGEDNYTKTADGTWWKQSGTTQTNTAEPDEKIAKFKDPNESSNPEEKVEYKKLGKEVCGHLQCFKYQVIQASDKVERYFVWYDDKDYYLRQDRSEGAGFVTESTYFYDDIDIKDPLPVKELGPNQYLIPGQNEPQTLSYPTFGQ